MTWIHPDSPSASLCPEDRLAAWSPRRWQVGAVAAVVTAVYLFGVNGDWWPTPDSALYQGLARNLFRGDGFRFNGHFSNDVTPGLPVLIGLMRPAFGEGYLALNLLMALCGLGALWAAYAALGRWIGRAMAFAAVAATACLYANYWFTHLILTDAPFALLFWLVAYACVRGLDGGRGWLAVAAGLSALAVAIRAPGAMFLGPLAAAVVLDRRASAGRARRLAAGAAVLLPATATVAAFYAVARRLVDAVPPYMTGSANQRSLLGRFAEVGGGLYRIPGEVAKIFTDNYDWRAVGLALALLAGAGIIVDWRRGRRLAGATILLNVLALTFLVGAGSVRDRYFMPLYPLLMVLVLRGLFWLVRWFRGGPEGRVSPRWHGRIATAFVLSVLAANLPSFAEKAIGWSAAGHAGRYDQVVEGGIWRDLNAAAAFLRRYGPETRIGVRWDRVRVIHYLTDRPIDSLLVQNDRWKPEHVRAVHDDIRARPELDVIAIDAGILYSPYAEGLVKALDGDPTLKLVFAGQVMRIYERRRVPGTGP